MTVTLKDASGINWWATRTVRANYVVGCDGAHSAVRKSIGGVLHGDAANQAWGVMDILANTDFPDVRQKCLISSANEGNVLILPREGGYVFRMYVELDKLKDGEKAASRKFTQDDMIAAANRIIAPYSLDVKEVVWWSIYDIGHSITDKFDDVAEGSSRNPRVFTAGDACHTHSPKAGQGMNVSMQDTFNLGWKLVHVLQGRADASLLRSYSKERLTEAKRQSPRRGEELVRRSGGGSPLGRLRAGERSAICEPCRCHSLRSTILPIQPTPGRATSGSWAGWPGSPWPWWWRRWPCCSGRTDSFRSTCSSARPWASAA